MATAPDVAAALPTGFADEGAAYQQALPGALRQSPGNGGLYPWLQPPTMGEGYKLPPVGPRHVYEKGPEEMANEARWNTRYMTKRGKNGLSDYFGYEGFDGQAPPGSKPGALAGTGTGAVDGGGGATLDQLLNASKTMTSDERLDALRKLLATGGGYGGQQPWYPEGSSPGTSAPGGDASTDASDGGTGI